MKHLAFIVSWFLAIIGVLLLPSIVAVPGAFFLAAYALYKVSARTDTKNESEETPRVPESIL